MGGRNESLSSIDMFTKQKIKNNSTTQKNFSYTKGVVSLNFNLRTDIKTDLKDFAELLKVAILAVNQELEK